MALRSVWVTPRWPMTSSKRRGRHLRGENLVGHTVVSPDSTVVSRESRGGSDRGPEGPAAHVSDYLALLPSGPDAVVG